MIIPSNLTHTWFMEAANSLQQAIIHFAEFENCKQFMVELRWPDGVVKCPRCGSTRVTWLAKPRTWKCYEKHMQPTFTLKTGTIFEDSPIPLEKWLPAVRCVVDCRLTYKELTGKTEEAAQS